jgi:hypothetical protein
MRPHQHLSAYPASCLPPLASDFYTATSIRESRFGDVVGGWRRAHNKTPLPDNDAPIINSGTSGGDTFNQHATRPHETGERGVARPRKWRRFSLIYKTTLTGGVREWTFPLDNYTPRTYTIINKRKRINT